MDDNHSTLPDNMSHNTKLELLSKQNYIPNQTFKKPLLEKDITNKMMEYNKINKNNENNEKNNDKNNKSQQKTFQGVDHSKLTAEKSYNNDIKGSQVTEFNRRPTVFKNPIIRINSKEYNEIESKLEPV